MNAAANFGGSARGYRREGAISIVGRGRIVVWEGASLWLLEGEHEVADLQPHAHHAIQITFSLKGAFEVGVGEDRLAGPVAAVASNARHTFRAQGIAAFLFLAPESAVGQALGRELFAGRPGVNVAGCEVETSLAELRDYDMRGGSEEELVRLGRRIVARLPAAEGSGLADPRVLAMIDHARRNLEQRVTLEATAASVHLSPSRARHLFAAQTGLPLKTYVLWLRLEHAVALYAGGSSLTEAAHEAGFADSAHFSRTFRRTFGLPAAALRLRHD